MEDIEIGGRLVLNGIMASHRATLAGAGIGLLAAYMVAVERVTEACKLRGWV